MPVQVDVEHILVAPGQSALSAPCGHDVIALRREGGLAHARQVSQHDAGVEAPLPVVGVSRICMAAQGCISAWRVFLIWPPLPQT